jgi:hypothetical protein
MGNGAKEDQNQDMYGALEKNKKQVNQGQCNVDTKKAETNNMKTSDLQTN